MHTLLSLDQDNTISAIVRASSVPDELPDGLVEVSDKQALALKVGQAFERKHQNSSS